MRGPAVQPFQAIAGRGAQHDAMRAGSWSNSMAAVPATPTPRNTREHREIAVKLVFGSTVGLYLTNVLPVVKHELAHWRSRAAEIADPVLRAHALGGLSKRGNLEGAALFAVLAPRSQRRETVRALVAFQAAYNYLDKLAEQMSADPVANGRQLHQALLVALDPAATHPDYYALYPQSEDSGFLRELVDTCRTALATLPSRTAVSAAASAAAARIVAFQSFNLTKYQGGYEALEAWARQQDPDSSGLQWWQIAAAGGSSLAVHALIATAANDDVQRRDIEAIEAAYFPWICALHSLLDSLVDVTEDDLAGQRNLLSYHANAEQASCAMEALAQRAIDAARSLPDELHHRVILTAMVGHYLSSVDDSTPDTRAIAESVAGAVGPLLSPTLKLFKARRTLTGLTGGERW
jgi:tetraprenyl-beta-curcumene synthase